MGDEGAQRRGEDPQIDVIVWRRDVPLRSWILWFLLLGTMETRKSPAFAASAACDETKINGYM
jgi:hypothetical protein